MQPLLKIQNIPISIEYTTKRATLQQQADPARVNITRQRGRAAIRTEPAQIKIDSYETRASAGLKSPARSIREFGEEGMAAGREATRAFAEEGNQVVDSYGKSNPVADKASAKSMSSTETIMAFIPSQRPEMHAEGGSISFDFTMDKLTFDWNINNRPQMEYVPGDIEFVVAQYPRVVIEYIGSPLYVPPSSNPDYVPPPNLDNYA